MDADHRLAERVLAGEPGAFHELLLRYERLVQHIVFRLVRDRADAEEVCQDVFVRVHRGLASFRRESKLSTWIGRIAYRTALKRLERVGAPTGGGAHEEEGPTPRGEIVDHAAANPLDELARAELRAFVRGKVESLPAEQRAAVTLYHLDGMSVAEVAAVMQLPAGTVKSHLFRARQRLKEMLADRIGGGQP
jgi:RNA polymerase sigma factor (sigma-70 family)